MFILGCSIGVALLASSHYACRHEFEPVKSINLKEGLVLIVEIEVRGKDDSGGRNLYRLRVQGSKRPLLSAYCTTPQIYVRDRLVSVVLTDGTATLHHFDGVAMVELVPYKVEIRWRTPWSLAPADLRTSSVQVF